MNRESLYILAEMLGSQRVIDYDDWIMIQCPFAKWTHQKGKDRKPSFGISVGSDSYFNCFACSKRGHIEILPTNLGFMSGKDMMELREFIVEHTIFDILPYGETRKKITLPIINEDMLSSFESLPEGIRNIKKETINTESLKYDKKNNRLLIPIRDKNGRLVGLKGRALDTREPKYLLYTEYSKIDPKKGGVWYGMHHGLIKKKALVIVEGELDAVLLRQTGFVNNIWASMGANISEEQLIELSREQRPIVLFLDNDAAGKQAKKLILNKLYKINPNMHEVIEYSNCKDAGEMYEKDKVRKALHSIKLISELS